MNLVILIAIAVVCLVGVSVIAMILMNQQSQIDEINRQNNLEAELGYCLNIIYSANPFSLSSQDQVEIDFQKCRANAIELYGNDFQKSNYLNERESAKYWEGETETMRKMMEQNCRKEFIGQLHEMNNCIENNNDYWRLNPMG